MKRISVYGLYLCSFVVCLVGVCGGQVTTGTPKFGSFSGGPFDTVNLGSLNVHFAVPIAHRAGRGLPFQYDLTYDSSVWTPVSVSGPQTWTPVFNWGWMAQWGGTTGYITYGTTGQDCVDNQGHTSGHVEYINNWAYVDPFGVTHTFGGEWIFYSGSGNGCTGTNVTSFSSLAGDGSGLTLNAIYSGTSTITTPGAQVLIPPVNPGGSTSATTVTDANGNQITSSTGGVFTDTLGSTVLTVTGATPNPVNFQYNAPAGLKNVVLTYVAYPIQTAFGCSNIAEYTSTSNIPLVDKITLADGTFYKFTYEATPGHSGYYTGRLATVTLPAGGTITYGYNYSDGHNGIICADGSTDGLTRTLNPGGGVWTYTRSQASGHWQTTVATPPDPQNPQSASNNTVIDFQKDSASTSTNNFYETQRKAYQGTTSGTLLQTTVTCYNGNSSACTTTAVSTPISQVAATIQFPSNGLQAETVTSYNGYGLPTTVNRYGYASGAPGGLIQNTQINYSSLGNGIVDHPSSVLTYDGSSDLLSEVAYAYDEYSLQTPLGTTPNHIGVSGSRGNATTITNYSTTSVGLTKHSHYFDTGNVYQSYDVNGAITTYNYPDATSTCGNSFPTSVSLPVNSLSTSTVWNCTGAVATKLTDVNLQATNITYNDAFYWRPASSQDPALNTTNFTYTPTTAESFLAFNGNASVTEQLATVDGFGRAILNQRQQGYHATNYDSTQTSYDTFGRASQVTMPYVGIAGQTTSTAPVTTTTYDALNRPTQTTDAGTGYVSYTYNQNDVLQAIGPAPSGENIKKKQLEYDALGRLTSVCELTQGTGYGPCTQTNSYNGYMTTYTYGFANGHPQVTVKQNVQGSPVQTRTYVYDLLGRLISETNPENATTTDTFDAATGCSGTYNGDLVKRVDAKGNTTCYTYDAMHRVTSATYSGPYTTPTKTFIYDSATVNGVVMANAKGHLAEAYTGPSGAKITDLGFVYSVRGEPTEIWESTPNSGGYYHPTAAYWANGALQNMWISGLPSVSYGVEGEGRPSTVSASSGQNPVTAVTYTNSGTTQPIGSLTKVTFGSGDSDNFTYDTNTGQMTQYKYTVSTNSEIGNLGWNANGSLRSLGITDPFNASDTQTCAYAHDDLSRLQTANCGSTWGESYSYDPFGNIDKSVLSGSTGFSWQPTYTSGATNNNQYFSLPGFTPTYDANGNLLTDSSHTYTWDAESKMLSLDSTTLTYDALGRMVEQNQSGTYFQIVYTPMGAKLAVMKAQVIQQAFVPLPGNAKAEYLSWGLSHYRHPDWLGSSRLESSTTHTIVQDTAYDSFGVPYAELSGGNGEISFTGQNKDTAWLQYDFMYRQYDPNQGRWISPDPTGMAAVDPTSPQSWNRYAYVMNNPLAYLDPDGTSDTQTGPVDLWGAWGSSFGSFGSGCPPDYPYGCVAWAFDCAMNSPGAVMGCYQTPSGQQSWSGGGGGGTSGSGSGPANNEVPANPCNFAGRALDPSAYAAAGGAAKWNPVTAVLDLTKGFKISGYLDAQPLASGNLVQRAAYGNYVFGVWMAASGTPLSVALAGANEIAFYHSLSNHQQYLGRQMDSFFWSLPAANVANITNGYNAQQNGTLCRK